MHPQRKYKHITDSHDNPLVCLISSRYKLYLDDIIEKKTKTY